MRLIETTNSHVVFKEIDDNGVLISMQGFNYGTLHYKITNSKVTFYPNDLDSPWKAEVWSVNLPVMIDGELVDADGIDAALGAVMSDQWQEQIDALEEDLDAEIARATAEEERIEHKYDDEFDALHAKDAELEQAIEDEEIRAVSAETAINNTLTAEIVRATSAEEILQDNIDGEEARAQAEEDALERLINAETVRAQGIETALQNALNNEITRSLSADTNFDNRLDAEILRSTSADTQIFATMATKSDLNNYYTKTETDAKYCTKDYVDGKFSNSYTKPETDALLATKADKVSAITNAIYDTGNTVINFYNSNNAVVATIDASDFIVDGMVDNVMISGNNLVVTFNVDAGKQDIVVPLTNIFDPSNYYNKSEADSKFATKTDLNTVSGKVDTISGTVDTLSDKVDTISGVVTAYTADTYTKSDVDAKLLNKQDVSGMSAYTLTSVTNALSATVTSHTANTTVHVTAQDKTNWNGKQDASGMTDYATTATTNALSGVVTAHTANTTAHTTTSEKNTWNGKQDKLTAGTGIDITNNVISVTATSPSVDAYTKAESDAKFQAQSGMSAYTLTATTNALSGTVTSHTANTTVHVTSSEKSTWNAKSDFSGNYNDLTNKPTIPQIWTGTQAQFDALTVKDNNTIYLVS